MGRTRVLIVPEWYPWDDRPYHGVFCREQARTVAESHDVVVLAYRVDPELRVPFRIEESVEDGLRTFRLRFWHVRLPKLDGASKLIGCRAVLARLRLSGWAPDLIHAHEYQAGRTALMLGRLARVPLVVSEHYSGFALGSVPPRDLAEARRVFERAATVSPVSRDLASRLRKVAPGARFESVPNAVDTRIFHPAISAAARPEGRPLQLVTVASLVKVKGHRYLLEALALLVRERDVELRLVGDGPLKGELMALARSLDLESRVHFLGTGNASAVAAALRTADVFVLPSLWENLPCALLEAMACGLPAVATRVGGVPEVLGDEAGVIVESRSPEALAEGIAEVAARLERHDPDKLAARADAEYGFAAVDRRWARVYSGALAQTSGGSSR